MWNENDKTDPSTDGTVVENEPRRLVREGYNALVQDQASSPDKLFIGGHGLAHLDKDLVVLDHDHGEHPRFWTWRKKFINTAIVAGCCFLAPFSSTIFAPSIHLIMDSLDITNDTLGALQVSIFMFAFAVGPLFLAPLSETYGRRMIVLCGNLIFIAFSVGGGFSQTPAQLAITRFIAGLGGSGAIAIVGGVVTDLWDLPSRPKASAMIMLGPVLGPIIGPVCGGWMSERATWRWTLWIPAIASGVLTVIAFFYLAETYAPRVLEQMLKRNTSETGNNYYTVMDLESRRRGLRSLLIQFVRPVVYIFIDPAVGMASFLYSVIFGIIYLLIVTYDLVFGLGYHQSVGIVGTQFLAIGIGMMIGTFGTVKAMEFIFKKGGPDAHKNFKAESRVLSCVVGVLLCFAGLFIYGFTALKTHFIVPLVGVVIFAAGATNVMVGIQLYSIEGFEYPASAFAAISFLRCVFAGAFPLFGAKLFEALGIDWGMGLLAFLALGLCLPLMVLLYIFGPGLRLVGVKNMARFMQS
ncbi:major facilitator superfamily domain-containing protein [Dactylonectria macrodidyma]|uniref:Major facilitator superfamily domain-containing protein n=1 Tax=Dactylonectria macrodidyma TaxID=307937 RepID=A0A9P9E3T8_9HYPO|nr:major facilitator superfamily domain-containing protein [Dactylonectria macrodidyma]